MAVSNFYYKIKIRSKRFQRLWKELKEKQDPEKEKIMALEELLNIMIQESIEAKNSECVNKLLTVKELICEWKGKISKIS